MPNGLQTTGQVLDSAGEPLAFAVAAMTGSPRGRPGYSNLMMTWTLSTVANENGEFELPPAGAGDYTIEILGRFADATHADAYRKQTQELLHSAYFDGRTLPEITDILPLREVVLSERLALSDNEPRPSATLRAVPSANIQVDFDCPEDWNLSANVAGTIRGASWSHLNLVLHGGGTTTFVVPLGLKKGYISSIIGHYSNTPGQEGVLGKAMLLPAEVTGDLNGYKVRLRRSETIIAKVELPPELAAKDIEVRGVSIYNGLSTRPFEERELKITTGRNFWRGPRFEQRIDVYPGQPFRLIIQEDLPIGQKPIVFHEEVLVAEPGKDGERIIRVTKVATD
jgi:hypothetical protein